MSNRSHQLEQIKRTEKQIKRTACADVHCYSNRSIIRMDEDEVEKKHLFIVCSIAISIDSAIATTDSFIFK